MPTTDVDGIYDYETIYEFLEIFRLVNSTVIEQDDFARIAYESLEDGVKLGNLKYREMFFNPTLHTTGGVAMATIIDGLIDGCRAAEQDLGVRCRLIADVYRQDSPAMALQMAEEVLANRRDEVIGLGMDAAEAPDPPERFFEAFRTAGEAGLHLTSHAAEDGPPKNISTCLDLLGCERIDHGYHILEDDAVVERCRDDGIHFTCCPTSTAVVYGWPDLTTHPINAMMSAGLLVHLNSDDPTMFRTDIGKEYVDFIGQNEYPPETAKQLVRNGVDATWLDAGEKAALHRSSTTRSPRSTRSWRGDPSGGPMLANTDPALAACVAPGGAEQRGHRDAVTARLLGEDWVFVRLPTGGGRRPDARRVRRPVPAPPRAAVGRAGSTARCCAAATTAGASTPRACAARSRRSALAEHVPPRAVATVPAGIAERHGMVFLAPEPPLHRAPRRSRSRRSAFMHGALDPITADVGAGPDDRQLPRHRALPLPPRGDDRRAGVGDRRLHRSSATASAWTCTAATRSPTGKTPASRPASGRCCRNACSSTATARRSRSVCASTTSRPAAPTSSTSTCSPSRTTAAGSTPPCTATTSRATRRGWRSALRSSARSSTRTSVCRSATAIRGCPLDLTTEVHVKADRMTIELRRILAELCGRRAEADQGAQHA